MRDDGDFITNLRKDIVCAQERRASFIRQKITFVMSFVGIGSISFANIDVKLKTWVFLYFAPVVALIFDFYILGEGFKIKRAGKFIEKSPQSPREEVIWEKAVSHDRGKLPKIGGFLLSTLVLIGASIVLCVEQRHNLLYWFWVLGTVAILIVLWRLDSQQSGKLKDFEKFLDEERVNRGGN